MSRHGGCAAGVLAGTIALASAMVGGPARAAATTEPRITLVSQDAWTPVGGDLHLKLQVDGVAPGFSVSVVAHQALTRRSTFEQTLSGGSLGSVLTRGQVAVPVDALTTDAAGNRDLVIGLEVPGGPQLPNRLGARRAGVYPLEIDLRDASDQSRSRFVTYLVVAAPAGVTGAVASPLGVAWVWPLAAAPSILPDGTPDPNYGAQLRPDGAIGRQAAALQRANGVPVTIVPSPETLQTWDALAQENPRLLADGVATLRQAVGTDQMVAGPYVPLDLPSLLRAGLGGAVDAAVIEGADVLKNFFGGTRLDPRTALGRPIDDAALTRLRAGGVDRIVVEGGAVATTRSSRFTIAQPFELTELPSLVPGGGPVPVLAADTDLARLLAGSEPVAVRAQQLLAGLAVVAFEQPDLVRAVAIVNPTGFDPPAALLDAVLNGLRANPLLRPMTVDQVFEQVPAETKSGTPVRRGLVTYDPPAAPVSAERFNTAQARLIAFRRLAPTAPNVPAAQRALLASVSSAWNAPGGSARARAELALVDGVIDGFLARIHVPNRSTITLTARSGDIPLTFRNDTGQSVSVLVELQSPKLSFPDGAQRILSLRPNNTTVRFAVEARTSGSFPLQLTLRSADGALMIGQAGFRIEANAVSTAGLVLIVSAAMFLALWWIVHIRRERRRRHVGVEPTE